MDQASSPTNTLLSGTELHENFQRAAQSFAELTASMLGPRGAYKIVVPNEGDFIVTRDCRRVLETIEIDHPIGRLLYSTASEQSTGSGDGVVTAVFLASTLLDACTDSVRDGRLHARTVYGGLERSRRIAEDAIDDVSIPVDADPTDERVRAVTRAQTRTAFDAHEATLADTVTETLSALAADARPSAAGGLVLDTDDRVHVFARRGRSRGETRRFDGVLVKTEPLASELTPVRDARVATVDQKLYLETIDGDDETSRRYTVSSPDELDALSRAEDARFERLAEPILDAGVDVLVTRKGIDDRLSNALAREGVVVVRRAKPEEILESVAAATGATVVGDVRDLSDATVGYAGTVETLRVGQLAYTHFGECRDATANTILTRGGTWTGAEDTERGLEAILRGTAAVVREPAVVPGGGFTEAYVASRLRSAARETPTREALVLETVAEAFEAVVSALARNSGLDPLDAVTTVRARLPDETVGVVDPPAFGGAAVGDVVKAEILDSARVKRTAVSSALQTATYAIPIDEVLATK